MPSARPFWLCLSTPRHHRAPVSQMAPSQAWAQPCARRVCPPAPACAGTGDVLAAVGEPSVFTWRCPCERGRWATVPGRRLPCYLRRQPPPPRENALFRQLPDSSRAGSAGVRCQGNGDHLTHPPRYCSPASPEVPGWGEEEEEAAGLG